MPTIKEQYQEAFREYQARLRDYPVLQQRGSLTKKDAKRRIGVQEAIVATLAKLSEKEDKPLEEKMKRDREA